MPQKIEISHRTIVFTAVFLIFAWVLYYIRDILLQLFVSLLLTAILNPLVGRLTRLKLPRPIAIFAVYIILFGLFGSAIAGIIPPMVDQTTNFVNRLPTYMAQVGGLGIPDNFGSQFLSQLGGIPTQAAKFTVSVFSNVMSMITILIFTFYLLLAHDRLETQLERLVGARKSRSYGEIIHKIEHKLGGWARGQLALMLIVGLLTYIGLVLLGIPFAIPLALIAGLLEIVPYLGPILAAIPTVLVGFSISPVIGMSAGLLAFLVQTLENYVLVPKITEKSVGTSPVATIFALLVGLRLAGVTGAMLAIPVVVSLQVMLPEYFSLKSTKLD